jgi:cyclic pyranopterin phosphate synthase
MKKLDHIDEKGKISCIDTTDNSMISRMAEASGFIHLKPETIRMIKENEMERGEVISTAEISGIQAVKNTSNLIPLVHHVSLTRIDVKAYIYPNGIEVKSLIQSVCQQSLETEALTAVTVALLTLFEICKNADSSAAITDIRLLRKTHEG